MPRAKGDTQEVSIYRTLGAFPKLQKLVLTPNISNPATEEDDNSGAIDCPTDPLFNEFDLQFIS